MNESFQVSPVGEADIERAFSVLKLTADWLEAKGRRQRIAKTGMETYLAWQASGANFMIEQNGKIAGIFSLPIEPFEDWPEFQLEGPAYWIRALATHPDCRGQKVGELGIRSCLSMAGRGTPVFLDCVSDFLPDYYGRHGFKVIAQQVRDYGPEGTFNITLMKGIGTG